METEINLNPENIEIDTEFGEEEIQDVFNVDSMEELIEGGVIENEHKDK